MKPKNETHFFYKNHFELVAFRHRFFKRSQKSSYEYLIWHQPILKLYANNFFKNKRTLCSLAGYSSDDILSYCQIWCINLFGTLFVDALCKPLVEQQKILKYYLRQELSRFACLLFKKSSLEITQVQEEGFYDYTLTTFTEKNEIFQYSKKIPHKSLLKKVDNILKNPKKPSDLKEAALLFLTHHQQECEKCLCLKENAKRNLN